ncbi:MAG: hypothetical protein LBG71_05360 [Clostridiales Family XIII bacterium]|nr:hypothetical protein [Clostridiales Family XIII bacterium]
MRKRLTAVLAFTLLALMAAGCGKPKPEDISAEFMDMLENPTREKVDAAADYLKGNLRHLDGERVGELLLYWEGAALSVDNGSVDYGDLVEEYRGAAPDYVIELFLLEDAERKSPIISGAALQVGWQDLLDRAGRVEGFIRANRDKSIVKDDALWLYRRHVNAVLMGASNSPIFDYKTNEFSAEARALYAAYAAERPETALAWTLGEYRKYLESVGYKLDYSKKEESAKFFDVCSRLTSESEKRVYAP